MYGEGMNVMNYRVGCAKAQDPSCDTYRRTIGGYAIDGRSHEL
jgi:hypothetical protein